MQIVDNTIIMTRAECTALLAFASTDTTRAHMHALHIDADDAHVTAATTDGHTMCCARIAHQGGSIKSTTFSRPDVERALAVAKIDKRDVVLDCATGNPDPHAFPPWQQVMPERNEGACAVQAFNPAYLARLELVRKARSTRIIGVRLQCADDGLAPMRWDFEVADGVEWFGAIMPMRI